MLVNWQVVIMLYEDPTKEQSSEERFHVELHFSPGVNCCVEKDLPPGPGFRPHSRNKEQVRPSLQEQGTGTYCTFTQIQFYLHHICAETRVSDPHSFRHLDPDPHSMCGVGYGLKLASFSINSQNNCKCKIKI